MDAETKVIFLALHQGLSEETKRKLLDQWYQIQLDKLKEFRMEVCEWRKR